MPFRYEPLTSTTSTFTALAVLVEEVDRLEKSVWASRRSRGVIDQPGAHFEARQVGRQSRCGGGSCVYSPM